MSDQQPNFGEHKILPRHLFELSSTGLLDQDGIVWVGLCTNENAPITEWIRAGDEAEVFAREIDFATAAHAERPHARFADPVAYAEVQREARRHDRAILLERLAE